MAKPVNSDPANYSFDGWRWIDPEPTDTFQKYIERNARLVLTEIDASILAWVCWNGADNGPTITISTLDHIEHSASLRQMIEDDAHLDEGPDRARWIVRDLRQWADELEALAEIREQTPSAPYAATSDYEWIEKVEATAREALQAAITTTCEHANARRGYAVERLIFALLRDMRPTDEAEPAPAAPTTGAEPPSS